MAGPAATEGDPTRASMEAGGRAGTVGVRIENRDLTCCENGIAPQCEDPGRP